MRLPYSFKTLFCTALSVLIITSCAKPVVHTLVGRWHIQDMILPPGSSAYQAQVAEDLKKNSLIVYHADSTYAVRLNIVSDTGKWYIDSGTTLVTKSAIGYENRMKILELDDAHARLENVTGDVHHIMILVPDSSGTTVAP
jgi:hypothetical protein